MKRLLPVLLIASSLSIAALWAADDKKPDLSKLPPAASGTMEFKRDIQPMLARACVSCHGPGKSKAGLRLDRASEAFKGSDAGAVIKPKEATASRLLLVVAGIDPEVKIMPPKPHAPLSADEIGRLRAWIDQGADWPKDAIITPTDTTKLKHWAYQPIQKPPVPKVNASWARHNEIDAFVQARLEKEGIAPAPEADRATLVRRLSFDLLGLPPTVAEVESALSDQSEQWYEKVVDRFLNSPHYGERWGRHWLDLARYADSDGFEKDTGRPFAWRWRHWVIDAFNKDMPFDQFTIEQLAGDLLPNATVEQKVATGFHRNTLTNKEGGVDQEQFRVEAVVDRVNTTGKVWLGQTIGCSQCHDHKYDPFSQREYYQLFAFFNSDAEVDIPAPLASEIEPYNKQKAAWETRKAELQKALEAYNVPQQQGMWEASLSLLDLHTLPAPIIVVLLTDPKARSDKQKQSLAAQFAKSDKKLAELTKAVADHDKAMPKLGVAMTLALSTPRKTNVMIRGDFLRKGVEVDANVPAILPPLDKSSGKPTRLDLAKWLVAADNPLTARVIVNWTWHKYFGRGLVATLEDFGTQGEKPSHPELLDHLATEFVAQKWSMKALHKRIVTSATYRQSSRTRPELVNRDALNILLARQTRTRLEAEIIRDNALAASGLLTRTVGGHSVRPPQPAGIAELTYAGSARWVESTGPDRYRRGLYTWFQRTSPFPMLMTFDAPDGTLCCVRRERSNTPLQALTLLNDTVFVECSQALGKRIVEDKAGDVKERIRHGFRLCLAREPSATELSRLQLLFDDVLQRCRDKPEAAAKLVGKMKVQGVDVPEAAAWMVLGRTLLNLDEFVTRE
ncbi:MAG: PSD1 and planctomycete cytochrome C domain-containing protein [Gemmataceae bacterium]|nr:PSD1 and planctomycete cytochrome C domain-containing protein [Gemmataceae bacterium]